MNARSVMLSVNYHPDIDMVRVGLYEQGSSVSVRRFPRAQLPERMPAAEVALRGLQAVAQPQPGPLPGQLKIW